MKKLISNYAFNKTTKQVTFSDYASIVLENVLLITNVTTNTVIYNFADPTLGGTVSGNILTLTYNTSSMQNTDRLQVFYDDVSNQPATVTNQTELNSLAQGLYDLIDVLSFLPNTQGLAGDLRVSTLGGSTISTVATVTTVSSMAGFSGWTTAPLMFNEMNRTAVASNVVNCIVS